MESLPKLRWINKFIQNEATKSPYVSDEAEGDFLPHDVGGFMKEEPIAIDVDALAEMYCTASGKPMEQGEGLTW